MIRVTHGVVAAASAALALTAGTVGHAAASGPQGPQTGTPATQSVRLPLSPSSDQLAACFPHARAKVRVDLTTDAIGKDTFDITARGLRPRTDYTVFLLEKAASPFGAAEYIGDFTSDKHGRADNTFRLIVQEAFASTLVNGTRVRVDLNQVGAWFADPAGDDFCLGPKSPVTPFDGDNAAGVQAFNSANTTPLPPP
jgi:hypothetical protein